MKNYKLSRNLWIFAGLCFLLASILNYVDNKQTHLIYLNALTCVLSFYNAYISNKKIKVKKDNKE